MPFQSGEGLQPEASAEARKTATNFGVDLQLMVKTIAALG
jgi:hypothetical protein